MLYPWVHARCLDAGGTRNTHNTCSRRAHNAFSISSASVESPSFVAASSASSASPLMPCDRSIATICFICAASFFAGDGGSRSPSVVPPAPISRSSSAGVEPPRSASATEHCGGAATGRDTALAKSAANHAATKPECRDISPPLCHNLNPNSVVRFFCGAVRIGAAAAVTIVSSSARRRPRGRSRCRSPFASQTSPLHYWSLEREGKGVTPGAASVLRHPHSDDAAGVVVPG